MRRGLRIRLAVHLLRGGPRFRRIVTALIAVGGFVAGRVSVTLPAWANLALVGAAILSLPLVDVYLREDQELQLLIARTLLKRGEAALAPLARSTNPHDLETRLRERYPAWIAPGVADALRAEAAKMLR